MYEVIERGLNEKEVRLLQSSRRRCQERMRPGWQVAVIAGLLGYGASGLIVLAGNLLAKDSTPLWFSLLILLGVGTFLFISVARSVLKQNRECRRMMSVIDDALQHGSAREEIVQAARMVEVEEREDEGACYLLEVDEQRLLVLWGQEFYAGPRFPSTDFSLVELRDSRRYPIESYIDRRGEKLRPSKVIAAKDPLKLKIPYDDRFIPCRLDELEACLDVQESEM